MLDRCQVFDSREVRYSTRKRVARYTGVLIATAVFALVSACMLTYWIPGSPLWAILLDVVWLLPIGYTGYKIYQFSSVAWCVKVYPDRIEGYDYARRKSAIPWNEISRVDFTDQHIVIFGDDGQRLRISRLFENYRELGHNLLDRVLQSDVPVTIEGTEWASVDVKSSFPFLGDVTRQRP